MECKNYPYSKLLSFTYDTFIWESYLNKYIFEKYIHIDNKIKLAPLSRTLLKTLIMMFYPSTTKHDTDKTLGRKTFIYLGYQPDSCRQRQAWEFTELWTMI